MVGGKSLAVGLILEQIPSDTKRLISPFIGGGSVEVAAALELDIEVLAFDIKENFKCQEFDKSNVFNPFVKTLSGKLEIKSKTGRFTKAQVKKILCHEDTEVSIEGVYTDDYAWDNAVNFQRGKKMNRIDMLEEVFKYFHHATTFKNESRTFGVYTGGYSTLTEIKNKNIVLV